MTSAAFALYALGHLVLFAAALIGFLRRRTPATVPLLLVTAALAYGNAVLALGSGLGHGPLLEHLSVPRFFLHAVFTPLLMLSGLGLLRRAGPAWANSPITAALLGSLTVAMLVTGFATDMVGLVLEPEIGAGLVSYGNAAASGLPVAPIVTVVVLIAIGVLVWRHGAGPWLLAGALTQLGLAALGDAVVIAGNLGELALLAGLVLTDRRTAPVNDRKSLPAGP